jgi:hypothetical protein
MANGDAFIDTSALYALLDRNDARHQAVKHSITRIIGKGGSLVASDYVVAEAVNLANARGGHLIGRRVLDLIETSAGITVEWIGPARFGAAKTLFRQRPDQGYSFTDCTSFVLMTELELWQALTLDEHFRKAGFAIHPR